MPFRPLLCQENILGLVQQALEEAGVKPEELDCLCYTKACEESVQQHACMAVCLTTSTCGNAHPRLTSWIQGPGMGGPLVSVAVVVRMLAQMWKKPARVHPRARAALPSLLPLAASQVSGLALDQRAQPAGLTHAPF